jgi:phytoene dehydrogenase-like protein/NAD-dependent dihydropyrimidine dehydrogenase PreA subunit
MNMNIKINPLACTGCGYCVAGCASGAINLKIEAKPLPVIESDRCILCGDCLYICPNNVFSQTELEVKPPPLVEHYDMVVIGSGIGGLMTAVGLARAGKKVLVVEQLSFVGGKYTHLMYQGYAITTAAWTCPGPNSRIGKLMRKLEANVRWITIHDVASRGDHWVVTPDGRKFASLDETQETLVGGARGMAQVFRWIADMYDPNVSYPDEMTTRQYIEQYFPGNQEYIQYVETIITHCFASQTVDDFPAMETKRAIIDSLEQMKDWGTAYGGTAALVAAMEDEFRQHGGQIVTRTRVKRILLENGRAAGVELMDGRIVRANIVIHNAGLNRLIEMVGTENLPADYLMRLQSAVPANVAALILGTNKPLLGEKHSLLHAMGWERTLNCYAPTFFDPGLAPEGKHGLDVFWVMKPPYDHGRELEIVMGQLHKIFPEFDEVVEMKFPMFFTGMWTAEMAHRMQQSGTQRLNPQTPIENLYMVGYDCIGYGMAGDIIPHGVERALHLILQDDRFAPEDEGSNSRLIKWFKSRLFHVISLTTRLKAGLEKHA